MIWKENLTQRRGSDLDKEEDCSTIRTIGQQHTRKVSRRKE
jgi:hypothetical protein